MRDSDVRLIALVRAGSMDAAAALFDRYWPDAWRAAYAVVADRVVADDVAQESVRRAFERLETFDETRPFGPWLKRIVVNCAIDELRRRGRLEPLSDELSSRVSEPKAAPADQLRNWGVADAVAALPPNKRLVIVLRYWLELSPDEIAKLLQIPVGTVTSRISRAHDDLRALLQEEEENNVA